MKYLWVSLGRLKKCEKCSMNSEVFEHPYCINHRDFSHRNHKYIYHRIFTSFDIELLDCSVCQAI